MTTSRIICTSTKSRIAVDLPPDLVWVATCSAVVDNPRSAARGFVLDAVEIAEGATQVELTLPSGALVWIASRCNRVSAMRVYVVRVGVLDLLRESRGSDIAAFMESMSADRFDIQCAAIPEQRGVREAVLAELVAGGAEVYEDVSINWRVWARWDSVPRNGLHTEETCTVVDPGGRYVWIFSDRITRKIRDNVSGELCRLHAEAADTQRTPDLRDIASQILASLNAHRSPDLSQLAQLSARERIKALEEVPAVAVGAQRLLLEAVKGLSESLDRRRLSGDLLGMCTDPDVRADMQEQYVANKQTPP